MLDAVNEPIELEEEVEPEPLEVYCVRCRDTVWMEDPVPVRTRKGAPATRGDCPYCGGVVYRLGKTAAHQEKKRRQSAPAAAGESQRMTLPKTAIYLNYAPDDSDIAAQVASDLEKMGCELWMHQTGEGVSESESLEECSRMVILLSPAALKERSVENAWKFFCQKNKTVVIGTVTPTDPPDLLRRKSRFDLSADYKSAFRQMLIAVHEGR